MNEYKQELENIKTGLHGDVAKKVAALEKQVAPGSSDTAMSKDIVEKMVD